MREEYQLVAILLIGTVLNVHPQVREGTSRLRPEQTEFSMEQELVPVTRPTNLSDAALQALGRDSAVSSCLGVEKSSRDLPPASWFIASEIHLARADETDLIVLPASRPAAEMKPAPNACFFGPYTTKWWILRKVNEGYQVILTVDAHDIGLKQTRSNGYRDIEAGISTMQGTTVTVYKFDGHHYERPGGPGHKSQNGLVPHHAGFACGAFDFAFFVRLASTETIQHS